MECSKITENVIAAACGTKAKPNLEDEVLLMNYTDIDRVESKVTGNIVSELVLKSGATAHKFLSFGNSFTETGATFNKGTYVNTWTHSISLRMFMKNQSVKDFVNRMSAGANIIALVKNKEFGKDGDVRYEIYGWENGLTVSECTSVVEMTDGVVYNMKAASQETAQEPDLPKSFFAGNISDTDNMYNSLFPTTP